MPPAPEAGEVGGEEGGLEVFRNLQPQQKGAGPGHLGITHKIKVKIKGVAKRGRQQRRAAVAGNVGKDLADVHHQHIRHCHLFEKAQREQLQRPHGAGRVEPVLLVQLGQHLLGPADGSGGDGAEKAEEGRQIHKPLFGGHVAPAHVDQVGEGGKGVEADAQREGQTMQHTRRKGQHGQRQVEILEHRQHCQQHDHRCRQFTPPLFGRRGLQAQAHAPHEHTAGRQQGNGQRLPQAGEIAARGAVAPIENKACRKQKMILPVPGQKLQVYKSHQRRKGKVRKILKAQNGCPSFLFRYIMGTSSQTLIIPAFPATVKENGLPGGGPGRRGAFFIEINGGLYYTK